LQERGTVHPLMGEHSLMSPSGLVINMYQKKTTNADLLLLLFEQIS